MIHLFKNRKAVASGSPTGTERRPSRRKIEFLKHLTTHISIGTRIQYHPEYETETRLESLIVGYQIDKIYVFVPHDIEFQEDGDILKAIIQTEDGPQEFTNLDSIRLVIPGDNSSNEKKLDYQSRSSIGRTGTLPPRAALTVIANNIKVETQVKHNNELTEGPHKGLRVAILDVMLGTLETHEPRSQSRIPAYLPAFIRKDSSERSTSATLLDFSERAMRFTLDDVDDEWPTFKKTDHARIKIKPCPNKLPYILRGSCIKERNQERVFKIEDIVNENGKTEPFTLLHALEIKIDLMKLQQP